MAPDSDDDAAALRERVRELEQTVDDQQTTIDSSQEPTPSRRGVLAALTGVAGAGALGAYSQRGAAQAAGQVGTQSAPVDVEAWSLNVQDALAGNLDAGGNDLTNVGAVEATSGTITNLDGTDLQYESVKSNINGGQYQSAIDGLVVPIAEGFGVGNAIDPTASSNAVQDVIDDMAAAGVERGQVGLPPQSITVGEPATQPYIEPEGNIGIGPVGNYLPRIYVAGADSGKNWVGFRSDNDFGTFSFALDGGSLGLNNVTGHPIHFEDQASSDLRFPLVHLQGFGANGIHYADVGGAFQHQWGIIRASAFDSSDDDAFITVNGDNPGLTFNQINAYPSNARTGVTSDILKLNVSQGGFVDVRSMNLGDHLGSSVIQLQSGGFDIGYISSHSADGSNIVFIDGKAGNGRAKSVHNISNRGTSDYAVELGYETGDTYIGPIESMKGTLNNGKVEIRNPLKSQCFGMVNSADVTDNSGAAAGNFSCLGDFTTLA